MQLAQNEFRADWWVRNGVATVVFTLEINLIRDLGGLRGWGFELLDKFFIALLGVIRIESMFDIS